MKEQMVYNKKKFCLLSVKPSSCVIDKDITGFVHITTVRCCTTSGCVWRKSTVCNREEPVVDLLPLHLWLVVRLVVG